MLQNRTCRVKIQPTPDSQVRTGVQTVYTVLASCFQVLYTRFRRQKHNRWPEANATLTCHLATAELNILTVFCSNTVFRCCGSLLSQENILSDIMSY